MKDKKNKRFTWKKYHRWFGLVLSVFMLVFCVSGIILNHRQLFAGCEVSRSLMPSAYHIKNKKKLENKEKWNICLKKATMSSWPNFNTWLM
jgi:hypothetical protein